MGTIPHSTLTSVEAHEVKGAEDALANEILVAWGDGTATFARKTPARTVVLAQSGGDATTVAGAIAAATALTPTPTDPVSILGYPGSYECNNAVLPSNVSFSGVDGRASTILFTTVPTGTIMTLATGASAQSMSLTGAAGAGGRAIALATGSEVQVSNIAVYDCETGIEADGIGTKLVGHGIKMVRRPGEVLTNGIVVSGAASSDIGDLDIRGESGLLIANGVQVLGSGRSLVHGLQSEFCGVGIDVGVDGFTEINGSYVRDCTTGLQVGANAEAHCMGVDLADCTKEIDVTDATAVLRFAGGIVRHEGIFLADGSDFLLYHASDVPGDKALTCQGEFHVGSHLNPAELVAGGGESHVRGLKAFRNDNGESGTYVDVTDTLNKDNAVSAPIFSGKTANNCIFIGGDVPFPGVKMDITTTLALGTGSMAAEYWNGVTWVPFSSMSADSVFPYSAYGQQHLSRVAYDHIRFDWDTLAVDWATKTLNGETKYWARYRVVTAIDTIPEVNICKLHTHRFEINKDGYSEHFGYGEPRRNMQFHQRLVDDLQGASPSNATIHLSTDISITPIDNGYQNGQLDGVAGVVVAEEGLDTSRELWLDIGWLPSTTGTGTVRMEANCAVISEGDLLDGSAGSQNYFEDHVIAVPSRDVLQVTRLKIRVAAALPDDIISLSSFRDGSADSYSGNVEIVFLRLRGTYWR